MNRLRILYLEDSQSDAEFAGRALRKAGIDFEIRQVDTPEQYRTALREYQPDLVLADHSLYEFNSLEALNILRSFDLHIPFILVTGTVSEEFAAKILKEGADDYLLKSNLSRLPAAILNALEKFRLARERELYLARVIENEALMKEAEHLAHFGSWQIDMVNGHIKWSAEMYHILGYEPGEVEPTSEVFSNHVLPEDRIWLRTAFDNAAKNLASSEFEYRIIDKMNNLKYIYSKITVQRKEENPVRILGFIQDVSEFKKAQEKLLQQVKELARLEKELSEQQLKQHKLVMDVTMQAQEKERNELGRELHDNINQVLSTVKMLLELAREQDVDKEALIAKGYENVSYAIEEIRKLSKSLVTPSINDLGLVDALKELTDEVSYLKRLHIELHTEAYLLEDMDPKMKLMFYRIVQEQLSNISKYAKATDVNIVLKTDAQWIYMSISDNGLGFDKSKKATGIGLKNINSRVHVYSGAMNIESEPGKGCTLEIKVPINATAS